MVAGYAPAMHLLPVPTTPAQAGEPADWLPLLVAAANLAFAWVVLMRWAVRRASTGEVSPGGQVSVCQPFNVVLIAGVAATQTLGFWPFALFGEASPPLVVASILLLQFASLPVLAVVVAHKGSGDAMLRFWWLWCFVVSSVLGGAALTHDQYGSTLSALPPLPHRHVGFAVTWPVWVLVLVAAMQGSRSPAAAAAPAGDAATREPLLPDGDAAGGEGERGPGVIDLSRQSVLSQAMFFWLNPLLAKGWRKPLQLDDCPCLGPDDLGETTYARFADQWQRLAAKEPGRQQSLLACLWNTFWREYVVMGVWALISTLTQYAGPIMLQVLVDYVADPHHRRWVGPFLCLVLAAFQVSQSVSSRQWLFGIERTSMHMRSAMIAAVFRKGLRLSNGAKARNGMGEIVNYMSVDVQRISDFMWWFHDTWCLPLQAIIAVAILFHTVGWGTLAGMLAMFLSIGAQIPIAKYQQHIQKELMKAKDARMKATTEALNGMKVIKLWAWEGRFQQRVEAMRGTEYRWLILSMTLTAVNIVALWLCPILVAVSTLATCVWLGTPLSSGQVFTAIATFRIIQEPLFLIPMLISQLAQALVSVDRIKRFLHEEELQSDAVLRAPFVPSASAPPAAPHPEEGQHASENGVEPPATKLAIRIRDAAFTWGASKPAGEGRVGQGKDEGASKGKADSSTSRGEGAAAEEGGGAAAGATNGEAADGKPTLRGINLAVPVGARVAICGTVGAGKSSMLACILGELTRLQGSVQVDGSLAYVSQSAWIQSGSIEANILFGRPMERGRYEEALKLCSLAPDLEVLPDGDQTEIGERGVNLSGGQKQRIQLARALYQDCDTYLLDDPFSAVDAHTGTALFKEYILGALRTKTVVLVTHQVEFLPAADLILVMRDGEVVQSGRYEQLLDAGTDFGALVDAHNEAMDAVEDAQEEGAVSAQLEAEALVLDGVPDSPSSVGSAPLERAASLTRKLSAQALKRIGSQKRQQEKDEQKERLELALAAKESKKRGGLTKDEERETGSVRSAVYWLYLTKAFRGVLVPIIVLAQSCFQGTQVAGNVWLSYATTPANHVGRVRFIQLYAALSLGGVLFVLVRTFLVALTGLITAQAFFEGMLRALFRAPMAYFDVTPTGRILARASGDQSSLDLEIPLRFSGTMNNFISLAGVLLVTSYITPQVLVVTIPSLILVILIQRYFLASSRELQRIMGITKAPIINHFSESVSGAPTIRAFQRSGQFEVANVQLVNTSNRPITYSYAATEWFMQRLQLLSILIFTTTALLLVMLPTGFISPAMAGLSLAYGLSQNQALVYFAWHSGTLSNKVVAVERIQQFTELPTEAPAVVEDRRPPADWPTAGAVELQELKVRYREDTPLVLEGVSCSIQGGCKVGVVGRTGSGKSTLIQALFRLVEPAGGRILIDGLDITTMGLADLRSRLSIIPQEPTLFDGTVRSNMDPLGDHSDDDVWQALDKCQLGDIVREKDAKLDATVSDGGENWSVGQRQLFCLGRALLKRSRILVLDEATASVDTQTDVVIQRTLKSNFADCTVISVAHRIPTVIDADKVLVLDKGRVAEYDSPAKLLERRGSMFSALVAEYASRSGSMVNLASLATIPSQHDLAAML